MRNKFNKGLCVFCGGNLEERVVNLDLWENSKLFVIENVPAKVCIQCGEQVISSTIAKQIDTLLEKKAKPENFIRVPVLKL